MNLYKALERALFLYSEKILDFSDFKGLEFSLKYLYYIRNSKSTSLQKEIIL